ncbi:MAG: GNAT family N-acetyltransferase, partial [Bdellovibrio sp.]
MFTFLLDTNIFIQLEEVDGSGEIRKSFSEFSALSLKHKIQIQFHPLTKSEIERDKNESRRRQMLSRLTKYPVLENPPSANMPDIESLFGRIKRANDVNDSQLLFAIHRRCVNYLISEDDGLHQRARHGQVHERVLTVKAAINLIKRLLEPESVKLPHVRDEFLYNINLKDPIFDSLREGYKGFDDWYNTASAEQRKAWIVELDGKLAGVCIYKKEMVEEFSGLGVPNLKLCTFKVDEFARGGKLGELLLKQAFM